MGQTAPKAMVREIMLRFAHRTGLLPVSEFPPRRYLWTDAFALCNFLDLFRQTRDEKYRDLALQLQDQVHRVLGRHRGDDRRSGWISGLEEEEGGRHPTRGGLRIGKEMNERRPSDPFDERLEWERDGQYYHYLTKWMHALNRITRVTGDPTFNGWAVELAKNAHRAFTYLPFSGGRKRMYWKMSIDLSYPLLTSMGQHDPLDGFLTYLELQSTAERYGGKTRGAGLDVEISEMASICKGKSWVTDDPLGIGGLLSDAFKAAQLSTDGPLKGSVGPVALLAAARVGLESFQRQDPLRLPADYRLPFRELGLSIGLRAVERLEKWVERTPPLARDKELNRSMQDLAPFRTMGEDIEEFWAEPGNRDAETWRAHLDINEVMLATSLSPDGYLTV